MNENSERIVLDAILNFKFEQIPAETKFWMIRTKKGYFYNEFIAKKFVALAWNNIDKGTNLQDIDHVSDDILLNYSEISRPKLVINKCNNFINNVSVGDILLIPSKGSNFIAFALAGEYYEEEGKNVNLEHTVIDRIEKHEVHIDEVNCPYKKRRRIQVIRIVKSEELNFHLFRAITNYHGISNLDAYGEIILDQLYNYYQFKGSTHIIFNVNKKSPIGLTELSQMLYSTTTALSTVIPENCISTRLTLESPGDIVISLRDAYEWLCDNYLILIGVVVLIGGGSFLTVKLPGVPQIIKDILTIKTDLQIKRETLNSLQLDNMKKKIEIAEKLESANIDLVKVDQALTLLSTSAKSMEIGVSSPDVSPTIIDSEDSQDGYEDEEQL